MRDGRFLKFNVQRQLQLCRLFNNCSDRLLGSVMAEILLVCLPHLFPVDPNVIPGKGDQAQAQGNSCLQAVRQGLVPQAHAQGPLYLRVFRKLNNMYAAFIFINDRLNQRTLFASPDIMNNQPDAMLQNFPSWLMCLMSTRPSCLL